jgi:tetratricopeptide (TPR) repeat protein
VASSTDSKLITTAPSATTLKAIWLQRDFLEAFYNRAIAYTEKEDYDRALADLDIVLRFSPNNALALYARGEAKLKKKETEAGNADIAAAKAIDPKIVEEHEHARTH